MLHINYRFRYHGENNVCLTMILNLRMTLNAWCMTVGVHSRGVCVMMSSPSQTQYLQGVRSLNDLFVAI